jgi:hypothetical protein
MISGSALRWRERADHLGGIGARSEPIAPAGSAELIVREESAPTDASEEPLVVLETGSALASITTGEA